MVIMGEGERTVTNVLDQICESFEQAYNVKQLSKSFKYLPGTAYRMDRSDYR